VCISHEFNLEQLELRHVLLTMTSGMYNFRSPPWLATVLVGWLLGGCEPSVPDPERVLVQDNFEQPAVTDTSTGTFNREQAHSWEQSMKVGHKVGLETLNKSTWKALGQSRHLRLRLWAWLPAAQNCRVSLIVVSQRPGSTPGVASQELSVQTFSLSEVIRRYRQWVPATFYIRLPRELEPTDEVVTYIWMPLEQIGPGYVDDFSIENLD